jgi:hypothetical protein
MFCHKCGTETPDDSQFCRKCGGSLTAVSTGGGAAAAPALAPTAPALATQKPKLGMGVWIPAVLLVGILLWAIAIRPQFPGAPPQNNSATPQLRAYTITFNKPLTIPALNFSFVPFTLPEGSSNVKLQGHFTATGGSGNDIEAYVLTEDEFTNWKNGHATKTLYNSGRVTQDSPNLVLPTTAGTYYLVFNNKFSFLSPKAVGANLTFTYNHV